MAFLHGVETVEINTGVRPVRVVRAAVIGLVGIAPSGAINTPTLVSNDVDAAQFGAILPGFNIPRALDAIFAQGNGTVVVVNVFDPDTMTATETDEEHTVTNLRYQLDYAPIGSITVTSDDGLTTYVEGTDYTVDEFGLVRIIKPATIPETTVLKTTYDRLDSSLVTSADIIGTTSVGGVSTGMQAFKDTFMLFGFDTVIHIAPDYVETNLVAQELLSIAEYLRGFALIDAPVGTTTAEAITGRGPSGTINFNTNSKNAVLLFPHVTAINAKTELVENRPFSEFFAGVWTNTISTRGIQYSPSNKPVKGITGLEQPVSFNPSRKDTDANLLNENGITTVGNNFGSGLISWGNRSAAYPSSTAPDNFIAVLMTAYIIDKSIEQASLVFVDETITNGLIDSVLATVNAFIKSKIADGALIVGSEAIFEESKNPPVQIAAGHITFTVNIMPPTPAERITYDRFIDISLLNNLV